MKVAIVGSRYYRNIEMVIEYVRNVIHPADVVISGGAIGVDMAAVGTADALGMRTIVHLPDYAKHGRAAPLVRNKLIVRDCERLVAFWDGTSRGTQHAIRLARQMNREVEVFASNTWGKRW